MRKIGFVNTVVAAGGILVLGALLCAAPTPASGQSTETGAAPSAPMKPALAARRSSGPPDLLEGLTLADDQKAKIGRIREETRVHLAAVANDKKLSPEAADAMRRGNERLENGRILEVLTPEQQQQVRKRIAAWRATRGKPQYPLRPVPASK